MSTTRINDSDLASVALYDKVNQMVEELDAEVVKTGGNQTIGGTKTFTGRTIIGGGFNINNDDGSIEIYPSTNTAIGGLIDFHYAGSTGDYTSRIIESASGQLSYVGSENFTATNSTTSGVIATKGWVNNPTTATNVVHRTGDQTISGVKTFNDSLVTQNWAQFQNKALDITRGVAPDNTHWYKIAEFFDTNGNSFGGLEHGYKTTKENRLNLIVYKGTTATDTANAQISVGFDSSGNAFSYAPACDVYDSILTTRGISKATNGYCKLGNGLIIQWGNGASGTSTTVTLPTAFTSTNYSVTLNTIDNEGEEYARQVNTKTTTSFKATSRGGASSRPFNWIAIGY